MQIISTNKKFEESTLEILDTIILNLAKANPESFTNEDETLIYYPQEVNSPTPISLGNLEYQLENVIEMDVNFQRDSNDHKGDTPQQIVADYLSGQHMGNITIYAVPNNGRKKIIDGKHRLTHLRNFMSGQLVLTGDSAVRFWVSYIVQIKMLLDKKGDTKLNKLIEGLQNPKKVKSKINSNELESRFPDVQFTELPKLLQDAIVSNTHIHCVHYSVKARNNRGVEVVLDDNDPQALTMAWRKFYRMNNHKAKMTPDDNLWGMDSQYNERGKLASTLKSLNILFDITNKDKKGKESQDDRKKLNEMLVSLMCFLDKKFPWGGSPNKLVTSIGTNSKFTKIGEESRMFLKFLHESFEPNFNRMMSRGKTIQLPEGLTSIKGGNLTNIRQFTLFLYLLHKHAQQSRDIVLYRDEPTETMKAILDLGGRIITTCVVNKDSVISRDKIVENGLTKIFEENKSLFYKIGEFRRNQRTYDDLVPLYTELVKICVDYTV